MALELISGGGNAMSAVLFAVLLAASSSKSYLEIDGGSSGGAISGKITYAGKPRRPPS
jgi:hypothetical protein